MRRSTVVGDSSEDESRFLSVWNPCLSVAENTLHLRVRERFFQNFPAYFCLKTRMKQFICHIL